MLAAEAVRRACVMTFTKVINCFKKIVLEAIWRWRVKNRSKNTVGRDTFIKQHDAAMRYASKKDECPAQL